LPEITNYVTQIELFSPYIRDLYDLFFLHFKKLTAFKNSRGFPRYVFDNLGTVHTSIPSTNFSY